MIYVEDKSSSNESENKKIVLLRISKCTNYRVKQTLIRKEIRTKNETKIN